MSLLRRLSLREHLVGRYVMRDLSIKELFYITHISNVPSILKRGILSHAQVLEQKVPYTKIYSDDIVSNRKVIKTPQDRTLWEYANLYFKARNPMLYRVLREKSFSDIAVIGLSSSPLLFPDALFTDGNAASGSTQIFPRSKIKDYLPELQKKYFCLDYWSEADGTKRRIMAEWLVPNQIEPCYIRTIYVANKDVAKQLERTIGRTSVNVIPEPFIFFLPNVRSSVPPNIKIVDGDMFFSKYHTLTISVNTVGVMGKGVASRAKYQFPDVYVRYQDVCRLKKLAMGKPYLIKREKSIDDDLADDPKSLTAPNDEKWFLLFATKNNWRDASDLGGIEKGLAWVKANYEKEGIRSLAMSALGCGLGGLDWKDVGPLMCKYLATLSIQVQIYLPLEKPIKDDFVSPKFLLST